VIGTIFMVLAGAVVTTVAIVAFLGIIVGFGVFGRKLGLWCRSKFKEEK